LDREKESEFERQVASGAITKPFWLNKGNSSEVDPEELQEANERVSLQSGKWIVKDYGGSATPYREKGISRNDAIAWAVNQRRSMEASKVGKSSFAIKKFTPDADMVLTSAAIKKMAKPAQKPNFSEFTWSRENIEFYKNFKTPCNQTLSYR
jgi:hypothetical protein